MRAELDIDPADLLLCFCALGNFEHKGLRLVLEAISAAANEAINLLVVGGSGSEIREYKKLCVRLNIEKRIRFVGFRRDIRPYLWASDTFVFPSVYETFPLVCLQAAAASLPLIVTKIHGVEEFMAHGETGWIVARESASIRAAIEHAAENRQLTESMGRQAVERIRVYGEDAFLRRWKVLLEHELSN